MALDHSAEEWFTDDYDDCSDPDTQECQPRYTETPASDLTKHDRIRGEAQIQNAIDDTNIQIPENTVTQIRFMAISVNKGTYQIGSNTAMTKGRLRLVFMVSFSGTL